MFRATICPSSGEITVSIRHWYLSLCMGGVWSAGWGETPTSRPDATHTEWQIPVSYRYSNFTWRWAHGCPKHVEKRNKYTKQNCAPSWIYFQDCYNQYTQKWGGREGSVGIANRYGLDGSDFEHRWRRHFPRQYRLALGAQPASCTVVPGLLPGGKVALATHPHLMPRLKKGHSLSPPGALMAGYGVIFTLYTQW